MTFVTINLNTGNLFIYLAGIILKRVQTNLSFRYWMNADAELPDCFLQTGEDLEQIQTESDWRCCPRRC